jgi:transposase
MNESELVSPAERVHWVGVDVAKKTFDAALVRDGQKWSSTPMASIPVHSFARTHEGAGEFVAWLDSLTGGDGTPCTARAVMEATGRYSIELAIWMTECRPSLAPAIEAPQQTAAFMKSLGLRGKTDKMEARALGFYGIERQPCAYQPAEKEEALLRDLVRYRDFLVQQRVAEQNRAEEMKHCPFVAKMAAKRLAQMGKDVEKIESEMHKVADAAPKLKSDIDQLCTIYGVGFIVAATIRAELGDLRRFQKAKQLTAYAGLSPSRRQSGTSVNGRAHMDKRGNPRVRKALYLSAMVMIRGNNELQQGYLKLRDEGKAAMSALGAVMRKLLVLMRAILISGKPFDPLWKTQPKCAQTP